ncbi:MAG: hypothetical protein ACQESR_16490 [Planctomycetota bacterium]
MLPEILRNSTIFPNTFFLSQNLPVEPTAETVQDFQKRIAASSTPGLPPSPCFYTLHGKQRQEDSKTGRFKDRKVLRQENLKTGKFIDRKIYRQENLKTGRFGEGKVFGNRSRAGD